MNTFSVDLRLLLTCVLLCSLVTAPGYAQDDDVPFAQVYTGVGLTVPLAPDTFSRRHDVGVGAGVGVTVALPAVGSVFVEGDYGYFPGSFMGQLAGYGTAHQVGAMGGLRIPIMSGDRPGPGAYALAGAGVSRMNFGEGVDELPDGLPADPSEDEWLQPQSQWSPRFTVGIGTAGGLGDAVALSSELHAHYEILDHSNVFYVTPRLGVTVSI